MTAADIDLLADKLGDPLWRLTSGELYKIRTADGRGVIPFVPRPEQVELIEKLLADIDLMYAHAEAVKAGAGEEGIDPIQEVELKTRRVGYSTCLGVFVADCLAFRASFVAQLIDQTREDAAKKMNGIVKVALDSVIAEGWPLKKFKDSDSELVVDLMIGGKPQRKPSSFFAGTKGRGGAVNLGWYSELGVIQFEDPPRADEIVSGAFPAARHGIKFVETTWKGGKSGALWDIIKPTLDGIADDWKVHFTPWFVDPRNRSPNAVIDDRTRRYFADIAPRLRQMGVVVDEQQMRWYAAEWRTQGLKMKRENPTFLDECWTAPIEGAVYAAEIERARAEGRIASFPINGHALVHTAWDLGAPKNTKVWYFQLVGREIQIVDCDLNFQGTMIERIGMMNRKGYQFGKHHMPHDVLQTARNGLTLAAEMAPHLPGISPVPRTHSEWVGINHLLELFPSLVFRSPACDEGLDVLGCYHTQKGGNNDGELVHDSSSHVADALRTMAEAHRAGMIKFSWTEAQPRPDYYGRPRRGMKAIRVSA